MLQRRPLHVRTVHSALLCGKMRDLMLSLTSQIDRPLSVPSGACNSLLAELELEKTIKRPSLIVVLQ